jgi:hypothetical protein
VETQKATVVKEYNADRFQARLDQWMSEGYRVNSSFIGNFDNEDCFMAVLIKD